MFWFEGVANPLESPASDCKLSVVATAAMADGVRLWYGGSTLDSIAASNSVFAALHCSAPPPTTLLSQASHAPSSTWAKAQPFYPDLQSLFSKGFSFLSCVAFIEFSCSWTAVKRRLRECTEERVSQALSVLINPSLGHLVVKKNLEMARNGESLGGVARDLWTGWTEFLAALAQRFEWFTWFAFYGFGQSKPWYSCLDISY